MQWMATSSKVHVTLDTSFKLPPLLMAASLIWARATKSSSMKILSTLCWQQLISSICWMSPAFCLGTSLKSQHGAPSGTHMIFMHAHPRSTGNLTSHGTTQPIQSGNSWLSASPSYSLGRLCWDMICKAPQKVPVVSSTNHPQKWKTQRHTLHSFSSSVFLHFVFIPALWDHFPKTLYAVRKSLS